MRPVWMPRWRRSRRPPSTASGVAPTPTCNVARSGTIDATYAPIARSMSVGARRSTSISGRSSVTIADKAAAGISGCP